MLIGRDRERERVGGVLEGARSGRSGSVVIRGEAGIGKTSLIDRIAADAEDMLLVRGAGVESETELPFSGLHLMLYPYADRFDALPGQQAAALRSAFGLASGQVSDRFLIGAATLTLLSELAADRPVLCLVDDAQWLDPASLDALLFAARRLGADPIAMIFTVRDAAVPFPDHGLDVVRLEGLDRATAQDLVDAHAPGLTVPVRERLLDEAGGNPLALIELASALQSQEARHAGPLPVGGQVAGRVQEAFRHQLAQMPEATRLLLLVVAADGTADLGVVLRAAETLGLSAADLGPAEEARLVVLDGTEVRFRHPLIRAVTYQNAAHHQRIAAHGALARTLDGDEHADRRAWHLAAAATGPDESVAAELERAARRAGDRGGTAAVAAAYERAARLSTDAEGKARRLVHAARAAYDAGRPDSATRLAEEAAHLTGDDAVIAEATFVRAQVAYERTSPAADAELALEGAALIVDGDPEQAVSMLTEAVWCARDAGAHDLVGNAVELLRKVRVPAGSAKALVVGGLIAYGRPPAEGVPSMRAFVEAARAGDVDGLVERVIAGYLGLITADDRAATALLDDLAAETRAQGALGWLPYVLEPLAIGRLLLGDLHGAESAAAEGLSLAADLGMDMQVTALQCVTVRMESDAERSRSLAPDVLRRAELMPTNAALASWGLGLHDLADGHAESALEHLDAVCSGPARHDVMIRAVPDHAEAAVRAGRPDLARTHLPAFEAWAAATSFTALVSRCRALLAGDDAEEHYRTALSLHGDRAYDAARTRLLYGEWLRRRRRRTEARAELTSALDAFDRLGAERWAERARAELEALGDRPAARAGDADPLKRLTPQELQVVRLAATGLSNREIAAQLYLSPRTVGHHLYKAYPKIGVTRRMELARLVSVI
ncbi:helix-turn-helix transcriptional regulator [Actinomadura sp. KC216]|uniref:helix-turn-helix transcriptional regulator n=1 Tax=Actinomadura sp. KC216 TaxID=2530370 RepID=UPI001A9D3534|nr:helix-turn-helix transcriptional regulator [Actinomadura sp. KC216]